MRAAKDRIRHAVSFELIGLALAAPLGAWAFHVPVDDSGVIAVVGATIATVWNYLFNLFFDHAMLRLRGSTHKSLRVRIVHAVLFECGILLFLMPFIAWHLDVSLLHAFLIDASFAVFYFFYALVFNWAYDAVFPVPARLLGESLPR